MATLEITEEIDENDPFTINYEAQRERINRIIAYQKSLYFPSSSPLPHSAASCSSFASSQTSRSLLDLMKGGNTSLKRLFDRQHTGLSTYFQDYRVSPMTKTVPLWGSDTDDKIRESLDEIRKIGNLKDFGTVSQSEFESGGSSRSTESKHKRKKNNMRSKVSRRKSFRKLRDLGFWRCRGLGFKLRLKRVRIMICGRIS